MPGIDLFPALSGGITELVNATDWPAGLTPTELSYVGDVTSAIQAQIDGKAATSHTHTISQLSDWPSGLSVTELGYLGDVTSAVQSQLNGKAATPTGTPTGSKFLRDDNSWQTVNVSDATKLALDGSNTMTGDVNVATTKGVNAVTGPINIKINSSTRFQVTDTVNSSIVPLDGGINDDLELQTQNATTTKISLAPHGVEKFKVVGNGATNQTGNTDLRCGIFTRASSTAYNMVAVTSNTYGVVELIDDTMTGNLTTLVYIKAGAVASIVGDTTAYVTTLTAGAQIALTISGGYLVGTTSSSYTRKLGINCRLGEAV